jgi:hypothetical protein
MPLPEFIDKAVSDDRRQELFARTLTVAQDTALRNKRRALGRALAAGVGRSSPSQAREGSHHLTWRYALAPEQDSKPAAYCLGDHPEQRRDGLRYSSRTVLTVRSWPWLTADRRGTSTERARSARGGTILRRPAFS